MTPVLGTPNVYILIMVVYYYGDIQYIFHVGVVTVKMATVAVVVLTTHSVTVLSTWLP